MRNVFRPQLFFNHTKLQGIKFKSKNITFLSKIIASGLYFNSTQNRILEKNLKKFLGGGYVLTTGSGHDSLVLALSSLHLSKNDEVIFPVNSYPTAFPVCMSNATPVPVDVDENGQIDPKELLKKINKRTKAVVVVHLYGLIGNMEKILQVAKVRNIKVVEDCAQAFGTFYKSKPVGTLADIGCFSFYPTKNLATFGDGGALFTKDENLYKFFLQGKSYGEKERYYSEFLSFHSRLPEIQAGILNTHFTHFKKDLEKRKTAAAYYRLRLEKEGLSSKVRPLVSDLDSDPAVHLFVIEVKDRDGLRQFLKRKKIPTHVHYPYPIHILPAFSYLGYKKGHFPMAERLSKSILSLPFHSFLSTSEVDYIIGAIQEFYLD